jgi:hypothetical protein
MRKMILWTSILILASVMLMAQEEKFPGYSITFMKNQQSMLVSSAIFFGRSSAEVWMATVKMLIVDGKQIVAADRAGGFISARRSPQYGVEYQFFIEDTPDGATIFFPFQGVGAFIRKFHEDIYEGIAKQLRPKVK